MRRVVPYFLCNLDKVDWFYRHRCIATCARTNDVAVPQDLLAFSRVLKN